MTENTILFHCIGNKIPEIYLTSYKVHSIYFKIANGFEKKKFTYQAGWKLKSYSVKVRREPVVY